MRLPLDDYLYSQPKTEDSGKAFWNTYDDTGKVLELSAMYDDALKKTEFCFFATKVANAICEELGLLCYCTWGKWGSRIEPKKNDPDLDIEDVAQQIINHPAWLALKLSTKICSEGKENQEVSEYQWRQARRFQER